MRSVNVYIHFSVARDTAWEQRKHGAEDEIDAPTLGQCGCA